MTGGEENKRVGYDIGCALRLVFHVLTQIVANSYSDLFSMPDGFRRHFVGKTLRNVCHCDIAEIRSVGKLVIIRKFS